MEEREAERAIGPERPHQKTEYWVLRDPTEPQGRPHQRVLDGEIYGHTAEAQHKAIDTETPTKNEKSKEMERKPP